MRRCDSPRSQARAWERAEVSESATPGSRVDRAGMEQLARYGREYKRLTNPCFDHASCGRSEDRHPINHTELEAFRVYPRRSHRRIQKAMLALAPKIQFRLSMSKLKSASPTTPPSELRVTLESVP